MIQRNRPLAPRTAVCAAVITLLTLPAGAQTTPANAPAAEPQRITITGSNIKRVDVEGVLPVEVITQEDIKKTGYTTLTDVLRKVTLAGSNSLSELDGSGSFSAGASTVSLRSLGSQATLVLLNGRRIAPFAPADPNYGQAAVVNLDTLPLSVVEKIEILKSGASAIYGSDAIAGVINIITTREFTGGELEVSAAANTRGNYPSQSVNFTYGFGDLAADKYNVFANLEFTRRQATSFKEEEGWLIDKRFREFPYFTGVPRSSYSSNYFVPLVDPVTLTADNLGLIGATEACPPERVDANGICRFDVWPFQQLQRPSERLNFNSMGTLNLSSATSAFYEFSYNRSKISYNGQPQVWGDFGSWYAAGTGEIVNVPEVLPPDHPNNPFGEFVGLRHRFEEVGPRVTDIEQSALRVLGGLRGTLAAWDYETAVMLSQNRLESISYNEISRSALTEGILNGTYNFFNPEAGALTPDDLRLNVRDTAKSQFTMVDLKAQRELAQLAGGPLAMSLGTEYRRETRKAVPDARKFDGEVLGFGVATVDGSRNVLTAYAEMSAPFVKGLDVQLAARADRYSDYGTSANPKLGVSWKVNPRFAMRGGIETGFRAPSLVEIVDSDVSAFTTVVDPARCVTGEEDECFGIGVGLLVVANPNLKPEKSRGLNFGVVWEPVDRLSVSVDYFNIRRRNEVGILDVQEIIDNENSSDPRYSGRVVRGPRNPATPDIPGAIQVVRTGYFNLGESATSGVDIDARWRQSMGDWGVVNLGLKLSHTLSFRQRFSENVPLMDYVGYFNQPRTRGQLAADWEYAEWNVGMSADMVSGYKVYNPPEVDSTGCDDPVYLGLCKVAAHATYNLSVAYTGIKDLTLSAVVANLTNRRPPIDPNFYSLPAYNPDYHDGRGRTFTLSAAYKF